MADFRFVRLTMMSARLPILALVLAAYAGPLSAEWSADPNTGCQIWNPDPIPSDSVSWLGECKDGKASGVGVAQWYKDRAKSARYNGGVTDGRPEGRGEFIYVDGGHFKGDWDDGQRHGRGNLDPGQWRRL